MATKEEMIDLHEKSIKFLEDQRSKYQKFSDEYQSFTRQIRITREELVGLQNE